MRNHYYTLYAAGGMVVLFILQQLVPRMTDVLLLRQDVLFLQPWRLVTSMFIHGSTTHLLSNLIGLIIFGLVLESTLGSKRAAYYALGLGVFANIFSGFFYPAALGASGMLFGIIGLLVVLRPLAISFAYGMPLPMILAGAAWAIVNIGGLFIESNTGFIAHLAGLAAGVAAGIYLWKEYGDKKLWKKRDKLVSEEEFSDWERKYMR